MPNSLDTSSKSAERGLRGALNRVRQRARYWLVFGSMPVLWGLASNGEPIEPEPTPPDTREVAPLAAGALALPPAAAEPAAAEPAAAETLLAAATSGSVEDAGSAPAEPAAAAVPAAASAASAAAPAPSQLGAAPDAGAAPPNVVPQCTRTPLTPEGLAQALFDGHVRHFGIPPQPDRWACAWAHVAFEQARGEAVYSNNLGHVTARSSAGRVCRRRLRERVSKKDERWVMMDVWFPFYDNPVDGATAYWQLITTSYSSFLARCDEGDPRRAAKRLAEIGYFTGPQQPYIDGLAQLFVNARSLLIPNLMAASAGR